MDTVPKVIPGGPGPALSVCALCPDRRVCLTQSARSRALPAQVSFKGNFVYVKEASRIKGNYEV